MKLLLTMLFVALSINAQDIDRVDTLVNDISKLRESSVDCKNKIDTSSGEELKRYKALVKNEKDKNNILLKEISSLEKLNKKLNANSKNSEKSDKSSVKLLKDKDLKILALQKEQKIKIEAKDKEIKSLKNQIKISKNEKKEVTKAVKKPKPVMKSIKNPVVLASKTNSANTYRLKNESSIYDAISGKKIDTWEKETSFTSSVQKNSWIKITGYFVDKQWQKSQKELWVKKADAFKR